MIKELSAFGEKIRGNQADAGKLVHNAIQDIPVAIDLLINQDGSFDSFLVLPEGKTTQGEAITAKKGKARLLLDKAEEVLAYINNTNIKKLQKKAAPDKEAQKYIDGVQSKHELFLEKLSKFSDMSILKPVFLFYNDNKKNGIDIAVESFSSQVDEKIQSKNIAFRLVNTNERLHEKLEVRNAIIKKYEDEQQSLLSNKKCSICGTSDFPVIDKPHGTINKVPQGLPTGNTLVSYNESAYESYALIGNENSSICTNCARNYIEGLNRLLSDGNEIVDKTGKEKLKFVYTNRRDFIYRKVKQDKHDTAIIYWTRNNANVNEINSIEHPNDEEIGRLFDSVATAKNNLVNTIETDMFYSCTLSGASARIVVRDWIEMSLPEYRANIAKWFSDIEIMNFGKSYYTGIGYLVLAAANEKSNSNQLDSRIVTHLWNSALKNAKPPLWLLHSLLSRTRYIESGNNEQKKQKEPITKERAALIRLILNRNCQGGIVMNKELDVDNSEPAYICGQIFSVIVDIQIAALGKDVNAGVRERFFSFASTTPASAFGRLMKMAQNYLTKLRNEKRWRFDFFDKSLREVCAKIENGKFPALLTLEEQGQFALGYYHKKQATLVYIQQAKKAKELKKVLIAKEEEEDGNNIESV